MPSRYEQRVIKDFTGGRNGADNPADLEEAEVVEARNGDFHRTTGFRKRSGTSKPTIGSAFSGVISSLLRHTPANNPGAAELWACDDATPIVLGRMAGATTFTAVTTKDAIATKPTQVRGVSYNGKLFLFYDSTVNRAHVWDPNLSVPSVRRVGITTPAAPTEADTGSGSYANTVRYYRVRYRIKNGTAVVAQSEASASVTSTPSGSGTGIIVTAPASPPGESETHWIVEASDDNVTFYELSGEIVIATTTYTDSADVATYSDGTLSAVSSAFATMGSWRYGAAAFNRLFGLGNWESGEPNSRLWYTPAKGTADKGDDERVPNTTSVKNFKDLDEGTGGDGTGFAGPINGALFAFKYSQIWKIVPTGVSGNPLDIIDITKVRGAINQEFICEGLDSEGKAAIYFADPQVGPCSLGSAGVTVISAGIRDLWDTVNLIATSKVGQCVFYSAKGQQGQVWWWVATGSSTNDPDLLMIYDIKHSAWSVCDTGGELRLARCAVMFSATLSSSNMSRDLVPYISFTTNNNEIQKADTGTADDGTTFQALVKSSPQLLNKGKPFSIGPGIIVYATAASGVTLTVSLIVDLGRITKTGTVSLTAAGSETHVFRKVEGLELGGEHAIAVQFQIGDASAVSNAWSVNRLFVPITPEDIGP